MNEQYLWDRSGPADPEVDDLERKLRPLGLGAERARRRPVYSAWTAVAAAAAVALAAVGIARIAPQAGATAWQVQSLAGAARIGGQHAEVAKAVRAGEVLRTGAASEVSLRSQDVGQIDVGPESELRASTDRQVSLRHGQLHAYIWAPPREFVVDTPSARAVDLGCEYTLTVDGSGDGVVRVTMGWVAFQYGDHESFIPAGAECVTRRRSGPGIPFYQDATPELQASLAAFERGDNTSLGRILQSARERDALTLWHLLTRAPAADRGAVFDRFAQLVALPKGVTREGILRQDANDINLCWDALNLESTQWWRGWERKWQ